MFTVCYAAYGCFIACISLMKVANYIIYKQNKMREKMERKLIKRATKIKKGVVKRAGLKKEHKELEKRRNSPSERVARWIWKKLPKRMKGAQGGSLEDNRSIANVSVPRDRHLDADVVVWRQVRLFVKVTAQLTPCFAIIFGGLALGHIEEWNNLDCVYWAFITVFSVGYGDICPQSQRGRLFAFFYIPLGVGVLLQTIAKIVALRFNHQFEQVENVAAILREDLDGDGAITEAEFKLFMLTRLNCKPEAYVMALLKTQFQSIDITGDGTLTKAVSGRHRCVKIMRLIGFLES
jgi:hypothetical protein